MSNKTDSDIAGKMDEAVDLLSCLDISNNKLEEIAKNISGKIKSNPKLKEIVAKLNNSNIFDEKNEDSNQITKLQDNIKNDDMIPDLANVLGELSNDPEIIENIEKVIIPLLFSD